MNLDRDHYLERCDLRWSGEALRDARRNWHHWEELQEQLATALRDFRHNPTLKDQAGTYHNPDGTLTGFLWKLQTAWQSDKGRLDPLLDFCDHYQKVFLRRGLLIYCTMLLRELEKPQPTDPAQLTLT